MELLSIMEFVGTVAFAVTGALTAIEKDLDHYGIVFMGFMTAVGGGILRDIIIDEGLPATFVNPMYAFISIITSVVVIIFYRHILHMDRLITLCDAIGLAAFSAIGCSVATVNHLNQPFVIITLALLTGTGGGMIRDICAGNIPFVLEKEVYAVASVIGAVSYILILDTAGMRTAMYVCCLLTFVIRMICVKKDYHLKKVRK